MERRLKDIGLLKEGEKTQSPTTDKGKSPIPDLVEGEIDHFGFDDDDYEPQGGVSTETISDLVLEDQLE
ncbi:unnamed protein product [Calypogeia fissa]